ncbi:MAG: hypothetical protein AAFR61_19775 [Bacteroidota bacterium]
MNSPEKRPNWTLPLFGEDAFPWSPEDGIMPKRPKSMGGQKRQLRPRRIPRRR